MSEILEMDDPDRWQEIIKLKWITVVLLSICFVGCSTLCGTDGLSTALVYAQ